MTSDKPEAPKADLPDAKPEVKPMQEADQSEKVQADESVAGEEDPGAALDLPAQEPRHKPARP